MRKEYNILRLGIGSVLRRLELLRKSAGELTDAIQLEAVALEIEEHQELLRDKISQYIREDKITSEMATSLINDASFAYNIARNLVQMGQTLFIKSDKDLKAIMNNPDQAIYMEG